VNSSIISGFSELALLKASICYLLLPPLILTTNEALK
jgi:hypothetical protein